MGAVAEGIFAASEEATFTRTGNCALDWNPFACRAGVLEICRRKTVRFSLTILVILTFSLNLSSAELPQLAYSHRMFTLTPQFFDKAETKVAPVQPNQGRGKVLVIYWTSERGTVVSARALDGPPDLQKAAVDAMYQWKFKPPSFNGQPAQVGSAVIVDFSQTPPVVRVANPMSAEQLNPGFQYKCFEGLVQDKPTSVGVCKEQLEAVSRNSHSTSSDRFTAHDQYGLVLMKYSHDAKKALKEFSEAIDLAREHLSSTDAEWAYAYWHRATAEQQLGKTTEAEKDFSVAESSLQEAEKAIGNERIAAYYRELVTRVAEQHAGH